MFIVRAQKVGGPDHAPATRIQAMIQSTAVTEISAEADNAATARELVEAQIPDGYELIQVHNAMPPAAV